MMWNQFFVIQSLKINSSTAHKIPNKSKIKVELESIMNITSIIGKIVFTSLVCLLGY